MGMSEGDSMMPKLLLPMVAVMAIGGSAAGASVYLLTRDEAVEEVLPSPVVQASPSAEPTPTVAPTPALQTYRNEKYGYEVVYPVDWRVATRYMQEFAAVTSNPRVTAVVEDYAVLTSLTEAEEQQFIEQAAREPGGLTGLDPWYRFAVGESVQIIPTETSLDTFLKDATQGNVIRTSTDIRGETLASGQAVTRLTRREADDRGDYTYDAVCVPFDFDSCPPSGAPCLGVIIRIVKTADYNEQAFEAIFRSFRAE